jgi:hypothetical protein
MDRGFPPPSNSGPEAFFAQPANEGRTTANKFAVVTELQLKVGYAVTSWLRASIAYDFLYLNNVVRPGSEINRVIPVGQTFQQDPAVSSIYPMRLFNTTCFAANGLSFGLDFSY